jgi:Fe-S oxidoreductase
MAVEVDNAKDEVKEIVKDCTKCGLCRTYCPVLRAMREEEYSPRGKMILLDNGFFDKVVYDCTLCKSCEKQCPAKIEVCKAMIKSREILVKQKKENSGAKEMIKNLTETGNIFGEKK